MQHARLHTWRAWWDESEDRYRHWEQRDRDEETSEAFQTLLSEAGLAVGNDLTLAQLDRLCALARRLAPNRNLDRRLYTGSGEPLAFNRLLRALLYGSGSLTERLATFVERKGVGAQTVSQLLSAAFPSRYPLLSAGALSALELTRDQRIAAQRQAFAEQEIVEQRPAGLDHEVARILRDFVIYHAIREATGVMSYLELYRILLVAPREVSAGTVVPPAAQVRDEHTLYRSRKRRLTPEPHDASGEKDENGLLASLETYVAERAFTYPPLALRNYYVALKTKPFVILCGLSGTGKTRLTQLFAAWLTGDPARQYRLLPVRPDWTDSTPLLGYHNILAGAEGRYVSTRLLDFLREAGRAENAGRAYFVCLDEMNLARVEHYFADFLSAMEMPVPEIPLYGEDVVRIPPNLFVIGTVNVDETTHAFSRKVLDRANTIELSEVDLTALGGSSPVSRDGAPLIPGDDVGAPLAAPSAVPSRLQSLFLSSRVRNVAEAQHRLNALDPGFVQRVLTTLTTLNEALAMAQLSFGYRVRDETLIYLANSFDVQGQGLFAADRARNAAIALDFQILQKVLPRLSGTQDQIEAAVRALLIELAPASEAELPDAAKNRRALDRLADGAAFPRSARKLIRLLARVQRDGYVSFYEG